MIHNDVVGNAIQPGSEGHATILVPCDSTDGLQEHVRGNILSYGAFPYAVEAIPEYRFVVGRIDSVPGIGIHLACTVYQRFLASVFSDF